MVFKLILATLLVSVVSCSKQEDELNYKRTDLPFEERVEDLYASVARPVLELKGFQRVHLQKGEIKELNFEISPELLTMLDENMNSMVEPGEFGIMIGASSNDIRLRGILNIKG